MALASFEDINKIPSFVFLATCYEKLTQSAGLLIGCRKNVKIMRKFLAILRGNMH